MRELYDRLIREGEAGIDRLITEQMQEHLELDFKRKEIDRNGEFSTKDRQMLAEALSGFANSAGGLLIVGIDARPGADQIDCAQEARPIVDIRRFIADANTEIGRLVQPRLDGVSVAAIESERMPGAGYLLLLVERSERRPHRSEAKKQKAYFKRHGASFYEMEHNDIEDAFSRNATCSLEVRKSIGVEVRSGAERTVGIRLFLKNTSSYIAKFPYIVFHKIDGCVFPEGNHQPLAFDKGFGSISCMAGADLVIHPNTERYVAVLRTVFVLTAGGRWHLKNFPDKDEIILDFTFGCEAARAERRSENIWLAEFLS